jgi:hypothetical protein
MNDKPATLRGPAALEEAQWWAGEAARYARDAMQHEGDAEEANWLRRAGIYAQVARAHASVATACAEASRLLPVYADQEPVTVDAWREVLS